MSEDERTDYYEPGALDKATEGDEKPAKKGKTKAVPEEKVPPETLPEGKTRKRMKKGVETTSSGPTARKRGKQSADPIEEKQTSKKVKCPKPCEESAAKACEKKEAEASLPELAEGEPDQKALKKAKQSRKSAAYHRAKKEAIAKGEGLEAATAAAKKVPWLGF